MMPQLRKYKNNAEKQAAYRQRKLAEFTKVNGAELTKEIVVKRKACQKVVQEVKSYGSLRYDTQQAIYILLTGKSFRGSKEKLNQNIIALFTEFK